MLTLNHQHSVIRAGRGGGSSQHCWVFGTRLIIRCHFVSCTVIFFLPKTTHRLTFTFVCRLILKMNSLGRQLQHP